MSDLTAEIGLEMNQVIVSLDRNPVTPTREFLAATGDTGTSPTATRSSSPRARIGRPQHKIGTLVTPAQYTMSSA